MYTHYLRSFTPSIEINLSIKITHTIYQEKQLNRWNSLSLSLSTQCDKPAHLGNIIQNQLSNTTSDSFVYGKMEWMHRQSKTIIKKKLKGSCAYHTRASSTLSHTQSSAPGTRYRYLFTKSTQDLTFIQFTAWFM